MGHYCTVNELLDTARAEIGYHEKASNSQLDDKYANSGSANFTKYARDLAAAGYYNGAKNGDAWCDVFVDAMFFYACGRSRKHAEKLQCQTGDMGAGCYWSAGYYKAQGRFDRNPKPGDQIFFGSEGGDHTGIVESVTATTVTTIEGNSSDRVQRCTYNRNYGWIHGYGHPRYDLADGGSEPEPAPEPVKPSGVETLKVGDVVTFKGSTHYASSDAARGYKCSPGQAEVTILALGAPHPVHLVGVSGGCTVWGWVDADAIEYAEEEPEPTPTPDPTPAPTPVPVIGLPELKEGSSGGVVEALQQLLAAKGYYEANINGKFENATTEAVKDYQKDSGIEADGIVGNITWAYLLGVNAS